MNNEPLTPLNQIIELLELVCTLQDDSWFHASLFFGSRPKQRAPACISYHFLDANAKSYKLGKQPNGELIAGSSRPLS